MTGELPEGVGAPDVRTHAVNLSIVGTLINLSGAYLSAEEGTPEEGSAETELEEFIERVISFGPDSAGSALLVLFASLVTQAGDESKVQQWFDDQGKYISAALQQEESGD